MRALGEPDAGRQGRPGSGAMRATNAASAAGYVLAAELVRLWRGPQLYAGA